MNTTEKLDEMALRRPDFGGGRGVVMADGQTWVLPTPWVRFAPYDQGPGYKTILGFSDGDEYETLINAYHEAFKIEGDIAPAVIAAEISLGKYLLLRNYSLTTEQLRRVLLFSYDRADVEGYRIKTETMAVAFRLAPEAAGASVESP